MSITNIFKSMITRRYNIKTINNSLFKRNVNIKSQDNGIVKMERKILTLWERMGIPFANVMLIATAINLGLQAYWYDLYLESYIIKKDKEISLLEQQLVFLEDRIQNKSLE